MSAVGWRLCLAPMMRKTDRHFRFLARLAAPAMRLYTEMITAGAIRHGDRPRLLGYNPEEHPLALQVGGSDAGELAECARIAVDHGYDEINLNCGCPSDRVQSGHFGACLMRDPQRVSAAVAAMRAATPAGYTVSVKMRLGVDDLYDYDNFHAFASGVADAGADVVHVHARRAWLNGLNPRENREIPPLEYDWVYRLKRDLPAIQVIINGGITSVDEAARHLRQTDGIMLGRHAYAHPAELLRFDRLARGLPPGDGADEISLARAYLRYAERQQSDGCAPRYLLRHLLNLFQGRPGARCWRRDLTAAMAADQAALAAAADAVTRQAATLARTVGDTHAARARA